MGCRETSATNCCNFVHRVRLQPSTTTTTKTPHHQRCCCCRCCRRRRCRIRFRELHGVGSCHPTSSISALARLFGVVVFLVLILIEDAAALPMSPRLQYDKLISIDALSSHAVVHDRVAPSADSWRPGQLPSSSSSSGDVDDGYAVVRYYKLYSRSSRRHVRLTTSKIDARGNFSDPYTNLRVFSTGFHSQVRIQSVGTGNFLCFNNHGRLVVKDDIDDDDDDDSSRIEHDDATAAGGSRPVRKRHRRHSTRQRQRRRRRRRTLGPRNDPLCVFRERHSMDGFTELQSAHNRSWFVAFGRSGLTRRVAVTTADDESGASALVSSPADLRRSCQFVKTDFAYVDDGGQFSRTSSADRRHRTVGRGGGVDYGHQQQQQQHDYHGPSIDYRRVFAKLRSTATATSDGSSSNDRSPST